MSLDDPFKDLPHNHYGAILAEKRKGWDVWGNETEKFKEAAE